MKWLFDEGADIGHAVVMRQFGDEVEFVFEIMSGAEDQFVLQRALSRDKLILCEDKDFGELVVRQELPTAGVVLLRLKGLRRKDILMRFRQVYLKHRNNFPGHLTVVSRAAVRFRKLRTTNS